MSVIAKFRVSHVENWGYSSTVYANPVMPSDDDDRVTRDENECFWQASPNGELKLNINNPAAAEQFQPEGEFYLHFEFPKPEPQDDPEPDGAGG